MYKVTNQCSKLGTLTTFAYSFIILNYTFVIPINRISRRDTTYKSKLPVKVIQKYGNTK